ncbi:MAG: prolipoprotein diacylglyceryl transferase [Acidimicrobiia bacterium]
MVAAISYHPLVRIELGPLSISPHGLGIAVGFLLGARLMLPRARARGIAEEAVYPLLTRAALGALVGARLAYVVNHLGSYGSPLEMLQVWRGGISLLGGIIGAIVAALPRIRSSRLSFWKVMDSAVPGLALGIAVGRIGDLVIGDHLGKRTDFVLGYRCPPVGVPTGSPCAPTPLSGRTPGAIVHQTALYDLLLAGAILGLLVLLARRAGYDGFLTVVFGAAYGLARLGEDFLRDDLRRWGLTGSQWTALATVLACLFVLLLRRRTPRWGRWDEIRPGASPVVAETVRPDE